MKYTILLLLAAVLFSSCELTKRRYMPGYSVEWKHKAFQTILDTKPNIASNTASHRVTTLAAKEVNSTNISDANRKLTTHFKKANALHFKNVVSNYFVSNPSASAIVLAKPGKEQIPGDSVVKGKPHFYTGDEMEDDHARKSFIYGFLSLGSPAAGFLIMLGIVLSVGTTLANPAAYVIAIFGAFCALGLFFAILAIINGFIAINEINANPDTYTGKGESITGMILAALVPIGIAAYLLLRFL